MHSFEALEQELRNWLPPVTVILTPRDSPVPALSATLRDFYGVRDIDCLRVERLNAESVRKVIEFAQVVPFSSAKIVSINLTEASSSAINSMLKLVEEPPTGIYFILHSSEALPSTLLSRGVAYVLQRASYDPPMWLEDSKASVTNVLKSIIDEDLELMNLATSRWSSTDHSTFCDWLTDVTGRWKDFDDFGLRQDKELVMRLLASINSMPKHPRLNVRVALTQVIKDRKSM